MIQRHRDVCTESPLNVDCSLGSESSSASVHVRLGLDPVLVYPARSLEREHLKTTGIGQQRVRPRHELVKSPEFRNHVFAGAHVQVIGVRENDSCASRFQVEWGKRTYRRLSADRHESWSLDLSVWQLQQARSCVTVRMVQLEFKHAQTIAMASP